MEALYLTKEYRAELHLIHVALPFEYDPNNPTLKLPSLDELQKQLKSIAAQQMASLATHKEIKKAKIVEAELPGFSIAPTVLGYAKENDVDLIAMGTHGRRGLGHLFLGSVAEEVVRLAPCPVLTIRESKEPKPVGDVKRILVPIDFSRHAVEALAHAKELARTYGATLQVLHIIEEVVHPSFYVTGKSSLLEWMPEIKGESKKEMGRLLERAPGPEVATELFVEEGRAASDVVKFAKDHESDLIVIATHGLTGLQHLLIGSVAEKVARMAHCPVFTVKAFGKSLITRSEGEQSAEPQS